MGLYYKYIDDLPPEDEFLRVDLPGDPEACPKRWYPIYWRYQHNWVMLEVDTSAHDPNSLNEFWMHFTTNAVTMRRRKPFKGKYVAVRQGSEATTFWVEDAADRRYPLKEFGATSPGCLRPGAHTTDSYMFNLHQRVLSIPHV